MNGLSISLLMSLALQFGYRLHQYQVLPLRVLLTAPKGLKSLCGSTFYSRCRHHCPSRIWTTFHNDTKGVCGCISVFPWLYNISTCTRNRNLLVSCFFSFEKATQTFNFLVNEVDNGYFTSKMEWK